MIDFIQQYFAFIITSDKIVIIRICGSGMAMDSRFIAICTDSYGGRVCHALHTAQGRFVRRPIAVGGSAWEMNQPQLVTLL